MRQQGKHNIKKAWAQETPPSVNFLTSLTNYNICQQSYNLNFSEACFNWKCDADAVASVSTIQLPVLESIMSTTLDKTNDEHQAANCIDGDLTTLCHSKFKDDPLPWIALNFGTEADISKVEIINGNQQTNANFKVYVTSSKPPSNRIRWGSTITGSLPNTIGKDTVRQFTSGTLLGRVNGPFQAGQKISILKTETTPGAIALEI